MNIEPPPDTGTQIDDGVAPRKIDGRSKAAREARAKAQIVRSAPAPQRLAPRQQPTRATPVREPTRSPTRGGRIAVMGHNGEMLSRKRTGTGDIFAIPPELVPENWSYQWVSVTVVGNTEIVMDQNLMMAENGWRPVPAERYPGRFMPEGHKGSIIRGGQMLMERPQALTDEARAEDIRNARQLISDRNESLKLTGVKANLPDGFEMSGRRRGTGGNVRMQIDPGLDIPRPEYTLAEGDE